MTTLPAKPTRDDKISTPTSYVKGSVKATLKREDSGATTITVDLTQVAGVRADKVFSADCGRLEIRNGLPEFQFGQLDPFNESKLIRVVIVRYDTSLFVDREKAYEQFIKDIGNLLVNQKYKVIDKHYRRLFEGGKDSQPPVALFDASLEVAVRLGDRMTFVFLSHSGIEFNAALSNAVSSYSLRAEVEVTLPLAAGYELLRSWNTMVKPAEGTP